MSHGSENVPKVLFDMSHGEIFSPNDTSQASYTELYYKFYEKGFEVGIIEDFITVDTISGADVLILAGPMIEFSKEEIYSIKNFVKNGGNLLILIHISRPVHDLVAEFHMNCSKYIVADEVNQIRSSHNDFYVFDLEGHPLMKGVEDIEVFGSWSVASSEPARTIAWTSGSAWSDVNRNRKFDPDLETKQRLGIISVAEYGSGKVVVVADDAVLIDMFINRGDNRIFGENIIEWFREKNLN